MNVAYQFPLYQYDRNIIYSKVIFVNILRKIIPQAYRRSADLQVIRPAYEKSHSAVMQRYGIVSYLSVTLGTEEHLIKEVLGLFLTQLLLEHIC